MQWRKKLKILIFSKNWIGDVIFQLPAIDAIKEKWPEASILYVCPPRCVEILENHPSIDKIIAFEERTIDRSWIRRLAFIAKLRRERIDMAFLFHRSFTRAALLFLAGIPERIGYADKGRSLLLSKSYPRPEGLCHQVTFFLKLLEQAGIPSNKKYYSLPVCPGDKQQANDLVGEAQILVALNPGANRTNKRWPTKHYSHLAQMLLRTNPNLTILITGASSDKTLADEILENIDASLDSRAKSLCGKTTLGSLAGVFQRCRIVVSGDSGPLHIAAASGANVIGLFGPTDPLSFAPLGCGKNIVLDAKCRDEDGLKGLSPDLVFNTILDLKVLD